MLRERLDGAGRAQQAGPPADHDEEPEADQAERGQVYFSFAGDLHVGEFRFLMETRCFQFLDNKVFCLKIFTGY